MRVTNMVAFQEMQRLKLGVTLIIGNLIFRINGHVKVPIMVAFITKSFDGENGCVFYFADGTQILIRATSCHAIHPCSIGPEIGTVHIIFKIFYNPVGIANWLDGFISFYIIPHSVNTFKPQPNKFAPVSFFFTFGINTAFLDLENALR